MAVGKWIQPWRDPAGNLREWVLIEYEVKLEDGKHMAHFMCCDGWDTKPDVLNSIMLVRNDWLYDARDRNRETRQRVYRVKKAPCVVTPFDVELYRGVLLTQARNRR
jgi:hypothetical protein